MTITEINFFQNKNKSEEMHANTCATISYIAEKNMFFKFFYV